MTARPTHLAYGAHHGLEVSITYPSTMSRAILNTDDRVVVIITSNKVLNLNSPFSLELVATSMTHSDLNTNIRN